VPCCAPSPTIREPTDWHASCRVPLRKAPREGTDPRCAPCAPRARAVPSRHRGNRGGFPGDRPSRAPIPEGTRENRGNRRHSEGAPPLPRCSTGGPLCNPEANRGPPRDRAPCALAAPPASQARTCGQTRATHRHASRGPPSRPGAFSSPLRLPHPRPRTGVKYAKRVPASRSLIFAPEWCVRGASPCHARHTPRVSVATPLRAAPRASSSHTQAACQPARALVRSSRGIGRGRANKHHCTLVQS